MYICIYVCQSPSWVGLVPLPNGIVPRSVVPFPSSRRITCSQASQNQILPMLAKSKKFATKQDSHGKILKFFAEHADPCYNLQKCSRPLSLFFWLWKLINSENQQLRIGASCVYWFTTLLVPHHNHWGSGGKAILTINETVRLVITYQKYKKTTVEEGGGRRCKKKKLSQWKRGSRR